MVLRLLLACFAYRKRKISTRVRGGCKGDRVGRPLMGCVEDVDGRDFLRVIDFDEVSCPCIHFISNCTVKIPFWPLKGL